MDNVPVDVVVTYVDNTDPYWQDQISQFNTEIDEKRYRNWENLQYWYKLVKKNLEFAQNIYLVVSSESQIPNWVHSTDINIVLHEDIIPEKYLPTFNSTTIEMFLCKIKGLSEHFIYFNDDMFPVMLHSMNDFFIDGTPVYELVRHSTCQNSFRRQCRNSYRLACECLRMHDNSQNYLYIRHSATPLLKSSCEAVWEKAEDKIFDSITRFREPFNYTQYLFPDYDILRGNFVESTYDFEYYVLSDASYIKQQLEANAHKMLCLNDSGHCIDFENMKAIVNLYLDKISR